jgi:hypothetical protein
MKFIITLIIGSLLSGCATKITPEGRKTREIDKSWKNSCTYIVDGETSSAIKFGGKGNYVTVRNNIRNITAAKGGNAYMINDFTNDGMGHYEATFEIYNCPETKYQLPKKYEALEKLKELQDKGVITKEEYESEKKIILDSYN